MGCSTGSHLGDAQVVLASHHGLLETSLELSLSKNKVPLSFISFHSFFFSHVHSQLFSFFRFLNANLRAARRRAERQTATAPGTPHHTGTSELSPWSSALFRLQSPVAKLQQICTSLSVSQHVWLQSAPSPRCTVVGKY